MKKIVTSLGIITIATAFLVFYLMQEKDIIAYDNYAASNLVVLDAGHGGHDVGGSANGVNEKDITLDVTIRLKNLLENADIPVICTRENDIALGVNEAQDLKERVSIANQNNASLFVSIHTNASYEHDSDGFEIYANKKGKSLASALSDQLAAINYTSDRGVHINTSLYVLGQTNMASILVEIGFLDGPQDAQQLQSETTINKIANGLFQSITNELEQKTAS